MVDNVFSNPRYKKVHAVDRFTAKGLDLIFLVIATLILTVLWYPLAAVGAVCYALFHDAFNEGVSPGKMIVGLKVIRYPEEGTPITWKVSALRNISVAVFTLFALVPMIGWILMFLVGIPLLIFEAYLIYSLESGYRLGDILAGTRVVSYRDYKDVQSQKFENPENLENENQ
ncbi:MAG: RDD family protein [bacterium]